jgi:NitT/TauT family transport system permease protein
MSSLRGSIPTGLRKRTRPSELPGDRDTEWADPAARIDNRVAVHRLKLPWLVAVDGSVLLIFLALWQWLPEVPGARSAAAWLNPFYISSPIRVAKELVYLFAGTHGQILIWPYLGATLKSTAIGFVIGLIAGCGLGLILSNAPRLNQVANPIIVALNSVPRIALIPVIVIVAGPTAAANVVCCALVVFIVVFFNALAGGANVASEVVANGVLLGASNVAIMRYVRSPAVIMWTFAAMPNAISFGLLTVVTTEVLTGINGMGSLILAALNSIDSNLCMAVAVLLGAIGLILNGLAVLLRRRVLRWQ